MTARTQSTPTPAEQPFPGTPGAPAPQAPVPQLSAGELRALRNRRAELSTQFGSAQERRNELAEQLRAALPGADREGLEQRIKVLDQRLMQIESDIASTGREYAMAGGASASTVVPPPNPDLGGLESGQITAIFIVFITCVLMPMAIAYARRMWKRAVTAPAPTDLAPVVHRLDQLQQAVDTVAIEMERMGEGQRYAARLLSESQPPLALGAGQRPAEPVRAPEQSALRVPRSDT